MRSVVICSVARTPIAKFAGSFAPLKASELGAVAIRAAVERAGVPPEAVEEVLMGNVVSAGMGQAPARQAAIYAGLPTSTVCTTVNKVCASGMKTVMLGAQQIMLGQRDIVVAGGMESMSNIPHYLPQARSGYRLGNGSVVDGVVHDGLWDVYNNQHMGACAELCAETYSIGREAQDAYATSSYERAQAAAAAGAFDDEIVSVDVTSKKGVTTVAADEEPSSINLGKLPSLRTAFKKEGTVTAANASSLNDGAAALVLMSAERAAALGVTPLARIRGFGDAEQEPTEFTTAPASAVPLALRHAGVDAADVEYHEINEAFSVVALANMQLLGLQPQRVNVHGGAVALGHPIGMSGARIVQSLATVLKAKDASLGCASICNGGGGASAIVIERLS